MTFRVGGRDSALRDNVVFKEIYCFSSHYRNISNNIEPSKDISINDMHDSCANWALLAKPIVINNYIVNC